MQTYLEINLGNLKANVRNLKKLIDDKKLLAVVKSNAYGHGLIECAKTAIEAGADWLGVISLDEAKKLRQAGISKPILILAYVDPKDANEAAELNITIPIIDQDYVREIAKIKFIKPLNVHLKIETGLNRLGLSPFKKDQLNIETILETAKFLSENDKIKISGIYSHQAAVEEDPYNNFGQAECLRDIVDVLKEAGINLPIVHLAASAGGLMQPEAHFDMVRFGIAIYGLWPSEEVKKSFARFEKSFDLQPVLSYKTKIVHLNDVEKHASIGYGRTFRAKRPMTLVIIPIGYYEGLDRGLSNPGGRGEVLVGGKRCPIVGRICMNMTIIDVTNVNAKVGDEVVIIGKQGSEEITVDEIAKKIGTINYEIAARLPEHLERKYIS